MNRTTISTLAIAVALLLTGGLAFASTPTGGQTGNTKEGLSASDVTASVQFKVRRVETDPNRIYLFDERSEKVHVVVVSEKTRLTARRKKDFDGRRKLEFADLELGQTLKVVYRLDDGHITSIQVVEKAS